MYGGTKSEMERLLADAQKLSGVKYDISNLSDVYEAIHVIQTEIGITGTTAKEGASTVEGSMKAIQASWQNLLVSFAAGNGDISTRMNEFVTSLTTFASNIIPVYLRAFEGLKTGIAMAVKQFGPTILSEIQKTMTERIPEMINAASTMIQNALDGVRKNAPRVFKKFISGIPAMIKSMGNLIPTLVDAFSTTASAAIEQLVTHLPEILGSLVQALPHVLESLFAGSVNIAKGLLNGISKAFDTLAGQARYDGWELDTHLDLNVDAEANIDMSDAEQAVKERMETWEEELKGYGLTAGEIASLLAFSGTEEELVKFLADEYPDLKADAKEAVIRNFRMESYRKATVTALQSVGIIDPDFIADILYKKASGDDLGVEKALAENYPDLKQAALNAIATVWNNSAATSFTNFQTHASNALKGLGIDDDAFILDMIYKYASGDEAAVESALALRYPDIKQAAINALAENWSDSDASAFTNFQSNATNKLKGLGITDDNFILDLIYKYSSGDEAAVRSALASRYPDVKQAAIDALNDTWKKSNAQYTSGSEGSISFTAGLLVEVLTDTRPDDEQQVDAALEQAKKAVDKRIKELREYIDNGGENPEEAEAQIKTLQKLNTSMETYADTYTGKATALAKDAGAALMSEVNAVTSATDQILAKQRELETYYGRLYKAGVSGSKLSESDLIGAESYIATYWNNRLTEAEDAKQKALEANKSYETAEAEYRGAVETAYNETQQMLRDLIVGQFGNNDGETQIGLALAAVRDLFGDETLMRSELEAALQDAGYTDIIPDVLEKIFGPVQYDTQSAGELADNIRKNLDGVEDDVKEALISAVMSLGMTLDGESWEGYLEGEGFDSDLVNKVISSLFTVEDTSVDTDKLDTEISKLDFSQLGEIVAAAADAGLIEGVNTSEDLDINKYIIQALTGDVDPKSSSKLKNAATDAISTFAESATTEMQEDAPAVGKEMADGIDSELDKSATGTARGFLNLVQGYFNSHPLTVGVSGVYTGTQTSGGTTQTGSGLFSGIASMFSKKASAMAGGEILHGATLFGIDNRGHGLIGGEAGDEAIVGVASLNDMIQQSVNRAIGDKLSGLTGAVSSILNYMPRLANMQVVLDNGTLVGEMNSGLGVQAAHSARYNA